MTRRQTPPQAEQLPFTAPQASLEGLSPLAAQVVNIVFRHSGEDISDAIKRPDIPDEPVFETAVAPAARQAETVSPEEAEAVQFGKDHALPGVYVYEASDRDADELYPRFVRTPIDKKPPEKPGRPKRPTIQQAKKNARDYRRRNWYVK